MLLLGIFKVVKDGAFMFHYYVQLVPTEYIDEKDPEGSRKYSHQYSATEVRVSVLVSDVFLLYP